MAAFTLGYSWKEARPISSIIKEGRQIPEEVLTDEDRDLEELAD
jgi:hypothetical protein